jgi:hypothetical protein
MASDILKWKIALDGGCGPLAPIRALKVATPILDPKISNFQNMPKTRLLEAKIIVYVF